MSTPIGPSGWHPDPYGRFEYRYHNGAQWTADVAMGGRRFVDPNGSPGSPLAPGAYPMQAPNVPPVAPRTRGFAVASFIIGLISVLAAWLPFVFAAAAVGAALALVFGILGARKASAQDGHGRGFAIAGIALSVAAALLCIVGFMFTRLRQLRVSPVAAVVLTSVLRGLYHLYQGFGAGLGNALAARTHGGHHRASGRRTAHKATNPAAIRGVRS